MTEPHFVALRAIVRGRVQGVGFRDYVLNRARFLGLTGYVRNLPDGRSVEVVAEGDRGDLEQLADFLRDGPRLSLVNDVETEWGDATGAFDGFGVGYARS